MKKKFKTEVNELLHLLIHSLYSHSEIFLRELVSNASDALDKLKYLTLTDAELKKLDFDPQINIRIDGGGAHTLVVEDNGIGMNAEELTDSLGTIARSGTKNFLEKLTGDEKQDANLIGQFGVGFYSSFMVADKVEVISKKAGEEQAWKWTSDGKTAYQIDESEREKHGTSVILYLNEAGKQYGNNWQAKTIIKKYSDHVAFPIYLHWKESTGKEGEEKEEAKSEQINTASALWKRPKSEISKEDYTTFYKNISHDQEEPLLTLHTKAEGTLEYSTLFFVPKKAPEDLYRADYKPGVKLYVNRVFITDDEKELLPAYFRFLRGVIDSADLPLNVSREILQQNPVMRKIREASIKKILGELKKLSENSKKYAPFIEQYNRPLKEGLYSDWTHRDDLLSLVRYKSSSVEGWTSLDAYKDRATENQKNIYYLAGDKEENLRQSPLLTAYKEKGYEVLLMVEEIDEIVTPMIGPYKELEFKAINRSGALDDLKTEDDKKKEEKAQPILAKIKENLGDAVKKVVASTRLSTVPSCLLADDADPSIQMREMLKAMGQKDLPEATFVLEINPEHPVLHGLIGTEDDAAFSDVAHLLFEQALLVEGITLKDPMAFSARLNRVTVKALQ